MNYNHDSWDEGDRALITVESSTEVQPGTYLYEMRPSRRGGLSWEAIHLPEDAIRPRGRRLWQENGQTTHRLGASAVVSKATKVERVLHDCPDCQVLLNV